MDYLWLKAIHVSAVLIFTAGLLVQTIAVSAGMRGDTGIVHLVSRWDRRLTTPAMLAVWLSGAFVASRGAWFSHPWLWLKLILVVTLTGLHGIQAGRLRRLRQGDQLQRNAAPYSAAIAVTIITVIIAALAVAKPFPHL